MSASARYSLIRKPRGTALPSRRFAVQNHAVRSDRWRYIRYADGSEELYDESKDPLEWTNLAADARYGDAKTELARWLPKENKPSLEPEAGKAKAAKRAKQAAKN